MSRYSVLFTKSAQKEFDHLAGKLQDRIISGLQLLAHDPFSELLQIKKLKGADHLYRFRVGDYRVVYTVRNTELVVLVIKIGHRREIYR